ncbi:MAG: NlpC/P60 family protein [Propionibacteriaceae bacterium]|nr:NlpC/P60 family protein [Propionibacteriaceae bacterium]
MIIRRRTVLGISVGSGAVALAGLAGCAPSPQAQPGPTTVPPVVAEPTSAVPTESAPSAIETTEPAPVQSTSAPAPEETTAEPTPEETTVEAPPSDSPYVTSITPVKGGIPLMLGWNGTRVGLVQRKLGIIRKGSDQTYDAVTRDAVLKFQRDNGLEVDGVVGPITWKAMDLGYPFDIDAFQEQPVLGLEAGREDRIEQMIKYALKQEGSPYSWGGAGPYELGYDCSGLVLQAMYTAGRDPQPINVVHHAEPTYRTSGELYRHPAIQTLDLAERQRGDLLFWTNANTGRINHVSIYLGDNQMMEAAYDYAAVAEVRMKRIAPKIKRVF